MRLVLIQPEVKFFSVSAYCQAGYKHSKKFLLLILVWPSENLVRLSRRLPVVSSQKSKAANIQRLQPMCEVRRIHSDKDPVLLSPPKEL